MTPILGGIVVALVGAIATYVAAARKLSGKIATSEAASLWEESRAIRDDYRQRLEKLENRVLELEKKNYELAAENVRLLRQALETQTLLAELRAENERLKTTIKGRRSDDRTS
jgi:predicted RNase H-like nuclease (RuvC/YqgF family)